MHQRRSGDGGDVLGQAAGHLLHGTGLGEVRVRPRHVCGCGGGDVGAQLADVPPAPRSLAVLHVVDHKGWRVYP